MIFYNCSVLFHLCPALLCLLVFTPLSFNSERKRQRTPPRPDDDKGLGVGLDISLVLLCCLTLYLDGFVLFFIVFCSVLFHIGTPLRPHPDPLSRRGGCRALCLDGFVLFFMVCLPRQRRGSVLFQMGTPLLPYPNPLPRRGNFLPCPLLEFRFGVILY